MPLMAPMDRHLARLSERHRSLEDRATGARPRLSRGASLRCRPHRGERRCGVQMMRLQPQDEPFVIEMNCTKPWTHARAQQELAAPVLILLTTPAARSSESP